MSFTNVMTLFRTGHVMSLALNTFIEMSTFQIFFCRHVGEQERQKSSRVHQSLPTNEL